MFQCLYKCGSGAPSTQEYHIYPLSASILDIRLEKGIVCNDCNKYFGNNLENDFVHTHPLTSGRLNSKTKTRKGNTPKLFLKNGRIFTREDYADKCIFNIPVEPNIQREEKNNGDLVFASYYQPQKYNALTISRVLCKMAIESLFCFPRIFNPFDEQFEPIRKYARFGPSKEINFIWFAWRKVDHDGGMPKLLNFNNQTQNKIAWVVQLNLPRGTYVVPLIPINQIVMSPEDQKNWSVVDKPGVYEAEKEKIELNMRKVQNVPD
ncbi:MAG: hypothetical protein JW849_05610 [Phycisphaerae bacterium]|nr:hypothetical protein [Phycisphaerae bacterium]